MTLYTPQIDALRPSRAFALSCMGVKGTPDVRTLALLAQAEEKARGAIKPRVCYDIVPMQIEGNRLQIGALSVTSSALADAFAGQSACLLLSATLGADIDRMISACAITSPALALAMDGVASALIEAVCDAFCAEMEEKAGKCTPRFSPGYGDLPLSFQSALLSYLDAPRRIGLTLTQAGMMVPIKSVSALSGIKCYAAP